MKTNDKLEMKNCNMILTETQQKYQHYHLEKTDKYLQVEKCCLLVKDK